MKGVLSMASRWCLESELCIYRRVHEEWGKVKTVDDCHDSLRRVLDTLSPAEQAEYRRQGEIIFFQLQPKFDGDIYAAMDEFERLYPNAV